MAKLRDVIGMDGDFMAFLFDLMVLFWK